MLKLDSTEVDLLNPTYPELFGANPLIGQHLPTNAFSITQTNHLQHFEDSTMKPLRSCETKLSGKKLKLEMEEFRDLTAYLPTVTTKPVLDSGDELNTPIFEGKGPFDFTHQYTPHVYPQQINQRSTEDPFMYKIKTEKEDLNVLSTLHNPTESYDQNRTTEECVNLLDNNNLSAVMNDSILFSPCNSENGDNKFISNSYKQTPAMDDFAYLTNVDHFKDFLLSQSTVNNSDSNTTCVQSPQNVSGNVSYDTPENSNSGSEMEYKYSRLHLNITGKVYDTCGSLNTPDVIRTITDIENDNFNILDIVNDKDIETVSTEDLHLSVPASSTLSQAILSPSPPETPLIGKSPRKRRARADSDEDYVPPGRIGRKKIKITQSPQNDETDSDSEDETPRTVKRGRPPKRHVSVSSDCSRDGEAARYRELRDKNNEASRRSRLKRKMKEMSLEKEAEQLEEKNLKLKTQVSELEKTVNNFRNNLFKIMLNK